MFSGNAGNDLDAKIQSSLMSSDTSCDEEDADPRAKLLKKNKEEDSANLVCNATSEPMVRTLIHSCVVTLYCSSSFLGHDLSL